MINQPEAVDPGLTGAQADRLAAEAVLQAAARAGVKVGADEVREWWPGSAT